MIALDLFAALMAADLPNRCQIVLAEVLAAQYGPTKAKSVHLDPAQIEHYTGLHRNNARKAIGELTRAGILAVQADGSHAFVKDYESWTPGGKPLADRLGGGILRFASATLSRHGLKTTRRRNPSASGPIQPDCPDAPPTISLDCNDQASVAIQGDYHEAPETIPMDCGRGPLTDVVNPEGLTPGPLPQSPGIAATVDATGVGGNRKRACAPASEDQKDLRKEQARGRAQASDSPRKPDLPPMRPAREPLDFGDGAITGPGADSPAALALEAWAAPLGNDNRGESYAVWARQQCAWTPPEWIRAILERKVMGRTNRAGVVLLSKIASDWRTARKPEWPIGPTEAGQTLPWQRPAPADPTPDYVPDLTEEERQKIRARPMVARQRGSIR